MLDFQQKRKVRHMLYNRTTLIILGVALLIVMHSTWVVYQKKRQSEEERAISEHRLAELEARDTELKDEIGRIQTASGVEAEIRSKFNVAKESEHVVVLVDDTSSSSTTSTSKAGFWQRISGWFRK